MRGPPRGLIVFEVKDSRLSTPEALRELDGARVNRDANYAVLVVPTEDEVPAKLTSLREFGGDKLVVVYDPEVGGLALEVGYSSLAPECSWRVARRRASTPARCAGRSSAPLVPWRPCAR